MAGYLFGGIPAVRDNFGVAALGMLLLSLIPLSVEVLNHRAHEKKKAQAKENEKQVPH